MEAKSTNECYSSGNIKKNSCSEINKKRCEYNGKKFNKNTFTLKILLIKIGSAEKQAFKSDKRLSGLCIRICFQINVSNFLVSFSLLNGKFNPWSHMFYSISFISNYFSVVLLLNLWSFFLQKFVLRLSVVALNTKYSLL